tara:strand:+ start:36 stop:617 length:582 start_codon:yes stop_codon:yes gene_type:complete
MLIRLLIPVFITISIIISNDKITEDRLKRVEALLSDQKELAPDISLKSYNDSLFVLSELKGKVVLINFWATWCGPCRMEIPDFNELHQKYNDKGFEILGISLSDTKKQLIDFAKVYDVKYPLLYGTFKEIDGITRSYGGVPAVPWSFLIGVEGDIIKTYPGAIIAQWDPITYQNLIYTIEDQLKIKNNIQSLE